MLALTPADFSAAAVAWIMIIPTIVAALATAAAFVLPKLATLKTQFEALQTSHNNLSATVNAQGQSLNNTSLATPPPVALQAAQALLPATLEQTTAALQENTAATKDDTAAQLQESALPASQAAPEAASEAQPPA